MCSPLHMGELKSNVDFNSFLQSILKGPELSFRPKPANIQII